jgi:Putative zinc-finger
VTGNPDPFEHDDAAYVLGALSRADRTAYEAHLQTCARCSAAVTELAGLPGLLARLPGTPAAPAVPDPPPDTVLPRLLADVRRSRLRRRAWGAAAGIAAAAVLVAGTAAVSGRSAPETTDGVPVALAVVDDAPVRADLHLADVAWGTRVTMTCRYDGPVPGRYDLGSYQLVVVSAEDGSTQSVARWQALPGRDAHVTGSTDLAPEEIAEVQLRDGDGTVLLKGRP